MSQSDQNAPDGSLPDGLPPIRRSVIFYASVVTAYGLLAIAILALILV